MVSGKLYICLVSMTILTIHDFIFVDNPPDSKVGREAEYTARISNWLRPRGHVRMCWCAWLEEGLVGFRGYRLNSSTSLILCCQVEYGADGGGVVPFNTSVAHAAGC